MKFLALFISLATIYLSQCKLKSACPNARNHLHSTLPTTTKGQYSFFTWGLDLFSSTALSASTLTCLENTKNYATLGIFLGFSTFAPPPVNPVSYSSDVLNTFLQSSLNKELILYVHFNESSSDAITEYIQNQLNPFLAHKDSIQKVWVRTNVDFDCPTVTAYLNCQRFSNETNLLILNTSLTVINSLGFESGIYTNEAIWGLGFNVTNSISEGFASVPMMFDDSDYFDIEPSFDNWEAFEPWETPAAKMSGYWYIDEQCCWPGQVVWRKNPSKRILNRN